MAFFVGFGTEYQSTIQHLRTLTELQHLSRLLDVRDDLPPKLQKALRIHSEPVFDSQDLRLECCCLVSSMHKFDECCQSNQHGVSSSPLGRSRTRPDLRPPVTSRLRPSPTSDRRLRRQLRSRTHNTVRVLSLWECCPRHATITSATNNASI